MPSKIFRAAVAGQRLSQGEIVSDLIQYIYDPAGKNIVGKRHLYCVVASQDCDLERNWNERLEGKPSSINSVLFFVASNADERQKIVGNSNLWNPAKRNTTERFHVIENCPADADALNQGLPALIIDFRLFFTATPDQLYHQLANGVSQRAVLSPPYREHFQTRAMNYLARVPLDPPHEIA